MKLNKDFQSNMQYVLTNLKKDLIIVNDLEDKMYMELSKKEIIESLNYVYDNIKHWQHTYDLKQYDKIAYEYEEIDSIVSQLEFCLVDYDEQFHIEGISYAIFEIGKILVNKIKEEGINGK